MVKNLEHFRTLFMEECRDHVHTLESGIQHLGNGETQAETINECFRAAHSIKGGAGMFGLDRFVPTAHAMESLFSRLRAGETALTPELCTGLARTVDCLCDMIDAESRGVVLPPGFEAPVIDLLTELAGDTPDAANRFEFQPATDGVPENVQAARHWRISFRPHPGLLRRASEPLLLVRQLRELGELQVQADIGNLPPFAELQPLDVHISWNFELATTKPEKDIQAVFEFVENDCDLVIEERPGEILPAPPHLVAQPAPQQQVLSAAPAPAPPTVPATPDQNNAERQSQTIRVDVDKIDRLVNLAGEIAISQALVSQFIDQQQLASQPRLFQELSQLLVHIQSLQDGVMSIRAQQVRTVFDRMPKLIRELTQQLGKPIRLQVTGEQTEIDKTVIEQLADPIVHAIRNAADHGLESPAERAAAGKPADGLISLHAEQRGSRVLITITDDGRGLDRKRIREKAVERAIVSADADLSPDEIDNLVFLPGFSTAEQVTGISGRGVGMDVVRRNVQKLGGKATIRSEPGKGATMTLALPLTVAVLDGMIVRSGSERFIIPIVNIIECRANWQQGSRFIPGSGTVLDIRGRLVPVSSLGQIFGCRSDADAGSIAVVTDVDSDRLAAFLVDEIVGQQQVVVKRMAGGTGKIPGIAGATILGDGRVALIVDPDEANRLGTASKDNLHQLKDRKAA